MSTVIVTDLDDTLWPCHQRYLDALSRFDALMASSLGLGAGCGRAAFNIADRAWLPERAHSGSRWLESMVFAYGQLAGRHSDHGLDASVMRELVAIDDSLWETPEPFPGVLEALVDLWRRRVPVYAFSAGGARQRDKLRCLPQLFAGVEIVADKNRDAHLDMRARIYEERFVTRLCYVGDSVMNDMRHAAEVGYDRVVQVDTPRQWPPPEPGIVEKWDKAANFAQAVAICLADREG